MCSSSGERVCTATILENVSAFCRCQGTCLPHDTATLDKQMCVREVALPRKRTRRSPFPRRCVGVGTLAELGERVLTKEREK